MAALPMHIPMLGCDTPHNSRIHFEGRRGIIAIPAEASTSAATQGPYSFHKVFFPYQSCWDVGSAFPEQHACHLQQLVIRLDPDLLEHVDQVDLGFGVCAPGRAIMA